MAANLDIIINAEDRASAEFEGVGEALGGVSKAGESAGLSLTDLKSGLDLAGMAFKAVKGAVQSVIDPVVAYSKNIRDLSAFTGTSSEESSKLINVTDDLGIEYNTLRTAARKLVDDGLQPNIDTLADLSDEYLSIQDPVARSQFLIETFGSRAGPEMARLLEQGSEAIRGMAQEAESMGLVMDDQGVAAARRYEVAMDDFEDSVLSVKLAIAEGLLPVVSESIEQGADYVQLWKNVTAAVGDGRLSFVDYLKTSAEVVWTNKTLADVNAELTTSTQNQQAAVEALDPVVANMRLATENAAAAAAAHDASVSAETARLQGLADMYETRTTPAAYGYLTATDLLKEGLSGLTEQMIFNKAAANLSEEAALQLGISMGLVDTRVLALNEALPALKEKYDANHDGTISAAESTAGYAAAVQALTDALLAVPSSVSSTVTTNFVTNGVPPGAYTGAPAGPPATPQYEATGGNYQAGPLVTGEQGPELQFPNTPGYVMNNNMSSRLVSALEMIARGGSQQVNNFYGVGADMAAGQAAAMAGAF